MSAVRRNLKGADAKTRTRRTGTGYKAGHAGSRGTGRGRPTGTRIACQLHPAGPGERIRRFTWWISGPARAFLAIHAATHGAGGNLVSPSRKRAAVAELQREVRGSERRAWKGGWPAAEEAAFRGQAPAGRGTAGEADATAITGEASVWVSTDRMAFAERGLACWVGRGRVPPRVLGPRGRSRHRERRRDRHALCAGRDARCAPADPERQRARGERSGLASLAQTGGRGRWTSSRGAPGRTAMPRPSTGGSAMSSWRWRPARASGMPGSSPPLGDETNTPPNGLASLWDARPRPGSPPPVRLPPRPRMRKNRLFPGSWASNPSSWGGWIARISKCGQPRTWHLKNIPVECLH